MVQAINLKKGMIFSQDGKLIKVLKVQLSTRPCVQLKKWI